MFTEPMVEGAEARTLSWRPSPAEGERCRQLYGELQQALIAKRLELCAQLKAKLDLTDGERQFLNRLELLGTAIPSSPGTPGNALVHLAADDLNQLCDLRSRWEVEEMTAQLISRWAPSQSR